QSLGAPPVFDYAATARTRKTTVVQPFEFSCCWGCVQGIDIEAEFSVNTQANGVADVAIRFTPNCDTCGAPGGGSGGCVDFTRHSTRVTTSATVGVPMSVTGVRIDETTPSIDVEVSADFVVDPDGDVTNVLMTMTFVDP